jgi:hypothetical protein
MATTNTLEKTKILTREDFKKIDWVQNITGTVLHIPLSDDERGVVIQKDEVFQLSTFFDAEEKLKCRGLYDAINGIDFTGAKNGGKKTPLLRILSGPEDPTIVRTSYRGNRFKKVEGTQLDSDKNIYDVKLMEQKLKDMEDNLESMPDDEEKEMKIALMDNYRKKIEETKKQVEKDSKLIITKVGPDAAVSAEGAKEDDLEDLDA